MITLERRSNQSFDLLQTPRRTFVYGIGGMSSLRWRSFQSQSNDKPDVENLGSCT